MAKNAFSLSELFTLWYSRKWSRILGVIMIVATTGDVVFTLLNVAKYGINMEINPIARYMIGAGLTLTALWVVLNALSVLFIYIPLISLYLKLPAESREGKASTIISALLASRIAIVLYGAAVFHYLLGQATASVIIIGITLMFCIRFTMRHGDNLSLESIRLMIVNLWHSFKDSLSGFFSALGAHPSIMYKSRKRRREDENQMPRETGEAEGEKPGVPRGWVSQRRTRRIVIILASLIAIPSAVLVFMQVLKDVSGIEGLTRTIVTIGGGTQGSLFLIGFILTIVTVAIMVYLLLALFDEISRGKPKF